MLCRKCGLEKPEDEFSKSRKYCCKPCYAAYFRFYYATNPQHRAKHRKRCAKWIEANRVKWMGCVRKNSIRRMYGITQAIADETLVAQGGACAICLEPITEENPPKIDHCHATGIFRGILCQACNTGLGLFYDSVESLQRAIDYLRAEREPRVKLAA
jgi:hypothetical protein